MACRHSLTRADINCMTIYAAWKWLIELLRFVSLKSIGVLAKEKDEFLFLLQKASSDMCRIRHPIIRLFVHVCSTVDGVEVSHGIVHVQITKLKLTTTKYVAFYRNYNAGISTIFSSTI